MGTHIFWRLVWKEYRQQRDLMIAIGVIALMFYGIMLAWAYVENRSMDSVAFYHVAFMLSAFYALGCGATLFAGEHERETFAWLRSLPQGRGQTYRAKLFAGAATVVAVLTILSLLALAIARGIPTGSVHQTLGTVFYLFTIAEIFTWAVLFSLVLRQPLWAVAVAGLAYFATLVLLFTFGSALWQSRDDSVFLAIRGVLLVVLWTVNAWLGIRWLTWENGFIWPTTVASEPETVAVTRRSPTWLTIFSRLTWQWWRESRYLVFFAYGLILLLTWLLALEGADLRFVLVFLPAAIGSFLFFNDQWKQQQRFFADHGVSGNAVWWSRILVGLLLGVPWFGVVLLLQGYTGGRANNSNDPATHWLFLHGVLPVSLLLFSVGQFCSLRFRAGILGVFAGVCVSVMMLFWVAALRFLGILDWLGMYPLTFVLLATSWFYAADWLIERASWKHWLRHACIVVVPLVLYLGGIAAHRAYEIPNTVGSQVVAGPTSTPIPEPIAIAHRESLAKLMQPVGQEALTTARLYRELAAELAAIPTPTPAGGAMMGAAGGEVPSMMAGDVSSEVTEEEYQQAVATVLERFVEVSRRDDCDFMPDPIRLVSAELYQLPRSFSAAVDKSSDVLAEQGKIKEAIEQYLAMLRFARHFQERGDMPRLTTAIGIEASAYDDLCSLAHRYLPTEAIHELTQTLREVPYRYEADFDVAWIREYVLSNSLIGLDQETWRKTNLLSAEPQVYNLLRYLPWERERAHRWLNYQATVPVAGTAEDQVRRWQANTLPTYPLLAQHLDQLKSIQATNRAAIEVRLQLVAWYNEHGRWPESLEEVVASRKGQLPLDPATKRAFVYRPQGFDRAELASELSQSYLPSAGEAFLWSPSYHMLQVMQDRSHALSATYSAAYQRILQGTDEVSDQDRWRLGTFYKLGMSAEAFNKANETMPPEASSPDEAKAQNE